MVRLRRLAHRIDQAVERAAWILVPGTLLWMFAQILRGLVAHECFRP